MSSSAVRVGAFTIAPPPGWQVASLIAVGPVEEPSKLPGAPQTPFQQNLVVVSERVEDDETVAGYVAKQTQKLTQQGAMHRPPGPLSPQDLGPDREGVVFEHVVLGPGGEKVRQMQLVTLKGGLLHALIASHLDGLSFEAARAQFVAMLGSVRLG